MLDTKNSMAEVVYIVDDDAATRISIDNLIRSVGHKTVQYGSAVDFLASGGFERPGCLLLDVRLPGISGLELQQILGKQQATMPIVFMTGHGDVPMSVKTMKAGAVDFLIKPFREQEMLEAVDTALKRDRLLRAERDKVAEARKRFDSLTPRERQVLRLVMDGKMNKQIAFELGVSEITIKIHRGSAVKKMGATSMPELVKMAALLDLGED